MPRRRKRETENASAIPPSLKEEPGAIREEARRLAQEGVPASAEGGKAASEIDEPPRKRGRPPKAKVIEVSFPVEALAILHRQVWEGLATLFRSAYHLSEEAAREMASYADLCLRQYAGPALAEHSALAAYSMTVLTHLAALLVVKKPVETSAKPEAPAASGKRPWKEGFTESDVQSFTGPAV